MYNNIYSKSRKTGGSKAMKTYACIAVVLSFIMIFTPALTISSDTDMTMPGAAREVWHSITEKREKREDSEKADNSEKMNGEPDGEGKPSKDTSPKDTAQNGDSARREDTVEVMRHVSGKTEKVTMKEYLIGSVAGEMPAVYETEALKAQTVACFSYAKSKEADGVLLTDNPEVNQAYISKNELMKRWGNTFDFYYNKLSMIVDSVYGEYIAYDGQLIRTVAYHAVSPGKTKSSQEVWGGKPIPYLVSVDSHWDKLSPEHGEKGYGHGVGMSQFGANEMAKEGYSYKEILSHYYTGTEILRF